MITDFSKYKRVFAFGCSFTCWIFPTYADLIFKSCPQAELYNFGKSGGGNIFITNRITEANKKFKFNENDLVVVMWSTFARLDVWRKDVRWITPGNIFTQNLISAQSVKEVVDLDGMVIRDLSIIDVATVYLNNLPCDVIKFMSVPSKYDHMINQEEYMESVVDTYKDTVEPYGKTFWEVLSCKWTAPPNCYEYLDNDDGPIVTDYHPRVIDSVDFLAHHNVPITKEAIDYAHYSHEFLAKKDNKTRLDVINFFKDEDRRKDEAYIHLW